MITRPTVFKFIVLFSLTYSLLVIPGTGLNRKYAGIICSQGNEVFSNIRENCRVNLELLSGTNNGEIKLSLRFISETGQGDIETKYKIDTQAAGYLPLVFFLSLVIATSTGWKRKAFALFSGYIAMNLFVLLRIRVIILCGIILSTWPGAVYSEAQKASIQSWYDYFVVPMTLGYVFALILWISLCTGRKEWQQIRGLGRENIRPGKKLKAIHY